MKTTYTNIITAPAARIRRVVFDHPASTALFVYSHASSIVISLTAADAILTDCPALLVEAVDRWVEASSRKQTIQCLVVEARFD